ncbi:MAG TPA: FHA domain-containing protein [Vicinamibacterales bacterium]|nr:FHA domain-containing protein [Vicinamibacterales bacterium]
MSPKAFDLLALLMQRRPEAVAKAEIHQHLWPDTFVSDVNVAVLITEIRNALGDDARSPSFVRTVHRFGYAFSGAVSREQARGPAPGAAACWVTWGNGRAGLSLGDNVLGRDPSANVRIDAVGVSRRHAMVVIDEGGAVLHDLSSKNGTYVNGVRVTAPIPLCDGAEVLLGPVAVRFHCMAAAASTQTLNTGSPTRPAND